MKRLVQGILIISVVWIVMSRGVQILTQITSSEYHGLKKFADEQSSQFDVRLRKSLATHPDKILINALTPFAWDKVCAFSAETPLRSSLRHPNYTGRDYPALSGFGKPSKDALVFLHKNLIAGVILSSDIDIQYATKFCADYDNAKLIPTPRGKVFKGHQNGIFYRDRSLESIKPLGQCESTDLCSYVFTEL